MRGILIDPYSRTISPVVYDGKANSIRSLIQSRLFDVVRISEIESVTIDGFIDDDGMYREDKAFFGIVTDYGDRVLCGHMLLTATDSSGDICDLPAVITARLLERVIVWLDMADVKRLSDSGYFDGFVASLDSDGNIIEKTVIPNRPL